MSHMRPRPRSSGWNLDGNGPHVPRRALTLRRARPAASRRPSTPRSSVVFRKPLIDQIPNAAQFGLRQPTVRDQLRERKLWRPTKDRFNERRDGVAMDLVLPDAGNESVRASFNDVPDVALLVHR